MRSTLLIHGLKGIRQMGCSMSGVSNNSQQVRSRKPITRYQRVGKTEKSHQLCHDAFFDTTKSSETP